MWYPNCTRTLSTVRKGEISLIHLDYRDVRPIYEQIKDNLRRQIFSGVLREGDRLPSVRELAAEIAINPNTIQRELEAEGFLSSVPGKGSFVRDTSELAAVRKAGLLRDFDKAARELMALGLTEKELTQRISALDKKEGTL